MGFFVLSAQTGAVQLITAGFQTAEKAHIPKVRSNYLQINIFLTFYM